MNNNHYKIFEQTECPSHQVLQDYLDGKLSDKEKHLLEKHLIDCEMCSDELEGLSLLKEKDKLDIIVEDIKSRTLRKQGKIIPLVHRYRIAAAAAILIILAALILILQLSTDRKQKPVIAENNEIVAEKIQKQEKETDESAGQASSDKGIISQEEKVVKKEIVKPEIIAIAPIEDESDVAVATDDIEEITSGIIGEKVAELEAVPSQELIITESAGAKSGTYDSNKFIEDKIAVAEETEVTGRNEPSVNEINELKKVSSGKDKNVASVTAQDVSKKSSKSLAEPTAMDLALEKYNSQKYRSASKLYEEIISSDSINFKAIYYTALCQYELENYDNAVIYLDKVLSNHENPYYSKAEIKKAEILILQHKHPEAESLLQKIINSDGEYKPEAEKLFKQITK